MLRVLAIQEDKSELAIGTRDHYGYGGAWIYFMAKLPDGINMIMIEGQRGPSGSNGIAVDDIEVKKCPLFHGKLKHYNLIHDSFHGDNAALH